MLKKILIPGLTFALSIFPMAGWALSSGVTVENTLAFTSNASFTAIPEADFFDRIGATARFPISNASNRFSARYTQYFSETQNNLLALDYAASWKSTEGTTYEVRLLNRSYVTQEVGTTDQGFSRFGVAINGTWAPGVSRWTFRPEGEVDYYPGSSRTDFMGSFLFEHELFEEDSDASLSIGFTPGLNLSTESDFSRASFNGSIYFDHPVGATSLWGLSLDLTYSAYLAREASSTVLSGRKGRSSITLTTKESTWLVSTGVYWSTTLARDWEFRTDGLVSFQDSKSGTYNFSELQLLAAIRWRLGR